MKTKKIIFELYILFLGFFGFSILGQYLILEKLNFPFFCVELYFLPLLFIKRKQIVYTIHRMGCVNFFRAFIYLLIVFSIILAIVKTGSLKAVFEYRSIIYLLFSFFYMQKKESSLSANYIFKLSIYTMLGELCYIMFFSTSRIVSSTNCLAIALSIISSFVIGRYYIGLLCTAVGLLIGITSGFRIGIFVSILTLFEMCLVLIFEKKGTPLTFIKKIIWFALCATGFIFFIFNYSTIVYFIAEKTHMDIFAYFRVTTRVIGLISGNIEMAQEITRFKLMQEIYRRLLQVLPRGLIASYIGEYSLYIDVAMIYLYDIFGSIVAWCIVFITLKWFFFQFPKVGNDKLNSLKKVALWMYPMMIFIFLINNTMIVNVYQAIETGVILGVLKNKNLKLLIK